MHQTLKHKLLIIGLLLVPAGGMMLAAQPAAALPLPHVYVADAGAPCSLPDDVPGQQSGTVLQDGVTCCPASKSDPNSCLFAKYVNPLVQLLSALVGLAVVVSIIFGGVQYVTSGGDPQRAEAAKKRITESLVALAAFLLLYGFLQYVMPGGVFNG